uniref:Uncharacterized protein n=1 Tax=Setaria italica TaxID=4555 RepID=K3XP06_SETIT
MHFKSENRGNIFLLDLTSTYYCIGSNDYFFPSQVNMACNKSRNSYSLVLPRAILGIIFVHVIILQTTGDM